MADFDRQRFVSSGIAASGGPMFVTHLESAIDVTNFEAGKVWTVHQGRPLWVRYDLAAVRSAVKAGPGRVISGRI